MGYEEVTVMMVMMMAYIWIGWRRGEEEGEDELMMRYVDRSMDVDRLEEGVCVDRLGGSMYVDRLEKDARSFLFHVEAIVGTGGFSHPW